MSGWKQKAESAKARKGESAKEYNQRFAPSPLRAFAPSAFCFLQNIMKCIIVDDEPIARRGIKKIGGTNAGA